MKKLFALLLVGLMFISLCACSKDNHQQKPLEVDTNNVENEEEITNNTENDSSEIKFNEVLLADDENVTLWLIKFYAEDYNWAGANPQNEKLVTLKVKNKTEHRISIYSGHFYLDDEELFFIFGKTPDLDAGKSTSFDLLFAYDETPEHRALNNLEDLYRIEGTLKVSLEEKDGIVYDSYDLPVNIQAAINGGTSSAPEDTSPSTILYQIGDTVSTDVIEFTLTGFDYIYNLDPKTYAEKDNNRGGSIGPGKDMVFANPEYIIKNISKESVFVREAVEFTVDYNDGFKYSMNDNICYIVDLPGITWTWYSRGSGKGSAVSLSPLISADYDTYIPASDMIATDDSSPLLLIVSILSSNGYDDFVFQIR